MNKTKRVRFLYENPAAVAKDYVRGPGSALEGQVPEAEMKKRGARRYEAETRVFLNDRKGMEGCMKVIGVPKQSSIRTSRIHLQRDVTILLNMTFGKSKSVQLHYIQQKNAKRS